MVLASYLTETTAQAIWTAKRRLWATRRLQADVQGQLRPVTFIHDGAEIGTFACVIDDTSGVTAGGEPMSGAEFDLAPRLIGLGELGVVSPGDTFTADSVTGQVRDVRVLAPERAELTTTAVRWGV